MKNFWNFSAICGSSGSFSGSSGLCPEVPKKCPEVPDLVGIFQIFFIPSLFMIVQCSNYICLCMFFKTMGRDQERRTKQKLDHAGQSSSPGIRRNYKRTAQRGRSQPSSGTSQGRPCNFNAPHRVASDGSDGVWNFEYALLPDTNPETGEVQIDDRERHLRKHGRRIQPAVCPSTPPHIPVPFGPHQVECETYPQLHGPRVPHEFTPRLPKSYKQQSLSVTKEREQIISFTPRWIFGSKILESVPYGLLHFSVPSSQASTHCSYAYHRLGPPGR